MADLITAWTSSLGNHFPISQSVTANKPVLITGSNHFDYKFMGGKTVNFISGASDGTWLTNSGSAALTEMWATADITMLSYMRWHGLGSFTEVAFSSHNPDITQFQYATGSSKFELTGASVETKEITPVTGSSFVFAARSYGVGNEIDFNINNTHRTGSAVARDHEKFVMGASAHLPEDAFFSGSVSELMILTGAVSDAHIESYKRHILKKYLNPENISGLTHRWRGDTGISASDTVYSWTDSIGGAAPFNATETGKPQFIKEALNRNLTYEGFDQFGFYRTGSIGRNYLTGSSALHRLKGDASEISSSFGNDEWTIFCVTEKDRNAFTKVLFQIYDPDISTPDDSIRIDFASSDKVVLYLSETGSNSGYNGPVVPTSLKPVVVACTYNHALGEAKFMIDGGPYTLYSPAVSFPKRQPRISPSGKFYLMNRTGGNSACAKMYELMLFDRALTEGELRNLTSYAKIYWRID